MSQLQRAVSAYHQARETVSPVQQVVMLYDGAMRRIRDAQGAMAAGRVQDRYTAVGKAVAILEGLQSGLDPERGGEIAANLDRLYTHMTFRLHDLNLSGDPAVGDEILTLLAELRDAWAELARRGPQAEPSPPSIPQGAEAGARAITI